MKKNNTKYVICIDNEGYLASLVVGKVYAVIPDKIAEAHNMIRVIDASEEDYAFNQDRFEPITLPARVRTALQKKPPSPKKSMAISKR